MQQIVDPITMAVSINKLIIDVYDKLKDKDFLWDLIVVKKY